MVELLKLNTQRLDLELSSSFEDLGSSDDFEDVFDQVKPNLQLLTSLDKSKDFQIDNYTKGTV